MLINYHISAFNKCQPFYSFTTQLLVLHFVRTLHSEATSLNRTELYISTSIHPVHFIINYHKRRRLREPDDYSLLVQQFQQQPVTTLLISPTISTNTDNLYQLALSYFDDNNMSGNNNNTTPQAAEMLSTEFSRFVLIENLKQLQMRTFDTKKDSLRM